MLPPLRDVSNRPEVGTTLRNKLVRLMTHVDLGVKQIAAEFLFVLCKERGIGFFVSINEGGDCKCVNGYLPGHLLQAKSCI